MEKWRQEFRSRYDYKIIPQAEREYASGIMDRFLKQNPALMKLNPEIAVDQFTTDADGNPCNLFILFIGHRYIFDYRLIPAQFEGIEVKSHLCENMPKEFPNPYPGIQMEEYHSPDRYLKFIEKNITKIRSTLDSMNMKVDEALDALTGNWIKHIEWINKIKKERLMENKEHINFFNKLLEKTKDAYYKSDVYKSYGTSNWGYSVTATSFQKQSKIIVGFNWGVDSKWIDKGNFYGPQKIYPLKNFSSSYDDLGSLKRTFGFFHNYFETIPEVQINYCFFRSEKEDQITQNDLKLSDKLFDELIEYLEPSMLISFSKSLNNYLDMFGKLIAKKTKEVKSGNKHFTVTKGKVSIANKELDYFNLPHPNFPITKIARQNAWDFCFNKIK